MWISLREIVDLGVQSNLVLELIERDLTYKTWKSWPCFLLLIIDEPITTRFSARSEWVRFLFADDA